MNGSSPGAGDWEATVIAVIEGFHDRRLSRPNDIATTDLRAPGVLLVSGYEPASADGLASAAGASATGFAPATRDLAGENAG